MHAKYVPDTMGPVTGSDATDDVAADDGVSTDSLLLMYEAICFSTELSIAWRIVSRVTGVVVQLGPGLDASDVVIVLELEVATLLDDFVSC